MTDVLLRLQLVPALEDAVVDRLLAMPEVIQFSSHTSYDHGTAEASLSLAEQVTGRRRMLRIEVRLSDDNLQRVLQELTVHFKHSGMSYEIMPVLATGSL